MSYTFFDLPRLYKNDQIWQCSVHDHGAFAQITVTYGKEGGKLQTKSTIIKEGKNLGKANATTPLEQARLEAESKWNKQKDKLYRQLGEVNNTFSLRPMLAQDYTKYKHKAIYPCYAQPKLDGIRCLATRNGLFSRQGKDFTVLGHIEDALKPFFDRHPDVILDGELFTKDINFQEIISAVKRDSENELTKKVQYHFYDQVNLRSTFLDRNKELNTFTPLLALDGIIIPVTTRMVSSESDMKKLHDTFVEQGYEGLILRNIHGLYTPDKRSYDLLKVKTFITEEFKICDVQPDKNGHAVFTCETKEGYRFDVKPEGNDDTRRRYLLIVEDLIGQMLTVKFFEWTTSEYPVPRFPVGLAVRWYE